MVTCVSCSADLVFWNMPYAAERGALDVVLTDVNVEEFFKQVVVINRAHHHTTVLSSHRSDLGGWRTS